MADILIDFALLIFTGAASLVAGFWVRNGQLKRRDRQEEAKQNEGAKHGEQERRARETLVRLRELANNVAHDVGEHNTRVQEISDELTAGEPADADCVVKAVTELIDANRHMQQQLENAEERLQLQAEQLESRTKDALTDALTRLANRRSFDEELNRRLAEYQRHGRPVSVLMIDVDHFKKFNDTHGHQAGDEVLRGVARVVKRTVREMDIPCRYGGEEFSVVLPGTEVEESSPVAERVRKAIEKEVFRFEGTALRVTVSAGIAQLLPGEGMEALVQRADECLYASKEAGRNCCYWHDGQTCRPCQSQAAPAVPQQESHEQHETTEPWQVPAGEAIAGIATFSAFRDNLRQRLAEQKRGGQPLAVMLIEIDEYPKIVGRFGERGGDLAFRALTSFLKAAMREMDQVARFNSQVLALLLPSSTVREATRVSERLRQAMGKFSVPLPEGRLQFTASVGMAESQASDEVKHILNRAERALESAESCGANLVRAYTAEGIEDVARALAMADN